MVIDQAGAGHDEACLRGVCLRGLDEVAGAFEVDPPDLVGIGGAQDRGEVNDRLDALDGCDQGLGVQDVAFHGRDAGR